MRGRITPWIHERVAVLVRVREGVGAVTDAVGSGNVLLRSRELVRPLVIIPVVPARRVSIVPCGLVHDCIHDGVGCVLDEVVVIDEIGTGRTADPETDLIVRDEVPRNHVLICVGARLDAPPRIRHDVPRHGIVRRLVENDTIPITGQGLREQIIGDRAVARLVKPHGGTMRVVILTEDGEAAHRHAARGYLEDEEGIAVYHSRVPVLSQERDRFVDGQGFIILTVSDDHGTVLANRLEAAAHRVEMVVSPPGSVLVIIVVDEYNARRLFDGSLRTGGLGEEIRGHKSKDNCQQDEGKWSFHIHLHVRSGRL